MGLRTVQRRLHLDRLRSFQCNAPCFVSSIDCRSRSRSPRRESYFSISCWGIWIGANVTTALYAWVNIADLSLTIISAFNALCCAIVLVVAICKRFGSNGELFGQGAIERVTRRASAQ